MVQEDALITAQKKLNDNFFHLSFQSKRIARTIIPGQFVFIRVDEGDTVLLRRPISVAWVAGENVNIVYKVVGKGTCILSKKKKGDVINVMGPLGNGFSAIKRKEIILVAGGIGIASLISLMKSTSAENKKVHLLYGARTKKEFIPTSFFGASRKTIVHVTEDGSKGTKGFVTDALETQLKSWGRSRPVCNELPHIYTCGPLPMIGAVCAVAKKYGVDGEANLEERMACGVGACLGCATQTVNGVKTVCKDGPVFGFDELKI